MVRDTLKWMSYAVAALLALFVVHGIFGTTWSNKCDPGNQNFLLMKNDPVTGFRAPGQLFSFENQGPDNSWMCDAANLSVIHVGNVDAMYEAMRGEMTRNGWIDLGTTPDGTFAVYEKTIEGVKIQADVWKRSFYVELDMNGPESAHFGEFGFGGP